ncbi:MAG: hypothetical protein WBE44_19485 [Terriglobales bacterium]|jgi:hypothetical protein
MSRCRPRIIRNGAPKVFAVPRSEDHQYFALDFADRNQDKAEYVSIPDHATQVVNLKPATSR